VPVNLHGEGDDDALIMPESMSEAYEEARAYCENLAKIGGASSGGFMKTLLLRRIGSSLRAGLQTARKLLEGNVQQASMEEDAEAISDMVSTEGDTRSKLRRAIELLEAAGDDDPKLGRILL
jgi:hypothetical protein